ncbi:C-terminal domain of homeodomain 1-domain-containing protein [Mycena polygramma]|nr:C-terminal domain of homeodomain 1-domain-containing protein [Mycena polygramma]
MSSTDIHSRLLQIESDFLRVVSSGDLDAVAAFEAQWVQLHADIEVASQAGSLDVQTKALAHSIASGISISADAFLTLQSETNQVTAQLETVFEGLDLDIIPDTGSIPDTSSSSLTAARPDPSLPPYIEPAYKWLLKHLHNPYPKKEIKEKIADETGSSMERISDWFVDVRRRMGWTKLLREEFGRKRVNLIDAATRYYIRPSRKYPLPVDIHGKFVEMEAYAKEMYAAKLVPSALSNQLTAAVKDLTPELQEQARQQRLQKLEAQREAARLGVYPSPAPSGASSPTSDPGASTSFAGRKRSSSEMSDGGNYSGKRSRSDDSDAFGLPSPPYSSSSSPTSRKRRLSDADAPNAKRANRGVSGAIPVALTLDGTPEILADWFSTDRIGETNPIFEPGQLLDIKFFDPTEYFTEEEPAAPPAPVAKTPTLPTALESDTVTIELPHGAENFFDFSDFPGADFSQQLTGNLDFVPFNPTPMNAYPDPAVYEPEPFLEPFTGGYGQSYISRDSVVESFGFEHDSPLAYSPMPDGKASGKFISGLFEQQNRLQTEYSLYQPMY